ncbi:hypothetical protein BCR33DRAFT_583326 [Rhizoclosmatium globosum]|uniref:Uncharacterized protein n=1 Tax=Rhizoclosmatium globosum TaxID=329046 RepID=A0A1Y2CRJ5_9FUNG|nr:hypothetical protein BCR33DRAFT_583326 [Rhizoclosmatium globosum]|eukprot:ORY49464.1 hypothetical protein BCR33DRAFT_583326 [Rhizoclosmatium globosum]
MGLSSHTPLRILLLHRTHFQPYKETTQLRLLDLPQKQSPKNLRNMVSSLMTLKIQLLHRLILPPRQGSEKRRKRAAKKRRSERRRRRRKRRVAQKRGGGGIRIRMTVIVTLTAILNKFALTLMRFIPKSVLYPKLPPLIFTLSAPPNSTANI